MTHEVPDAFACSRFRSTIIVYLVHQSALLGALPGFRSEVAPVREQDYLELFGGQWVLRLTHGGNGNGPMRRHEVTSSVGVHLVERRTCIL